ncbi:hypothetical protein V3C99_011532 [Haemonchus contortus]|uniref:Tnp_DDE_dom domain-containing protein n=1 Tax=Haemonchus contortus TaxID=6289 RepID=A0A7I4Y5G2_HAECO
MIHKPRNIRPHPYQGFHEVMLEYMLWEYRSCGIYVKQMRELSELQAKIEHIKAWGRRSFEATVQQNRINNEIDDHIHTFLSVSRQCVTILKIFPPRCQKTWRKSR